MNTQTIQQPDTQSQSTTAIIPLTLGKVAIIDIEDYERVNQFKWHVLCIKRLSRDIFYGKRTDYSGPTRRSVLLHRFILNAQDGIFIDHRNGDGLDNRKENLRLATNSQNNQNRLYTRKGKLSNYQGVFLQKGRRKWRALIAFEKHLYDLGYFDDPKDAAHAYDLKAIELYGECARLNFPPAKEVIL